MNTLLLEFPCLVWTGHYSQNKFRIREAFWPRETKWTNTEMKSAWINTAQQNCFVNKTLVPVVKLKPLCIPAILTLCIPGRRRDNGMVRLSSAVFYIAGIKSVQKNWKGQENFSWSWIGGQSVTIITRLTFTNAGFVKLHPTQVAPHNDNSYLQSSS